ncbi:MAG: phenylacetate--CoA ligase family protein [Candidatus Pelagibacter sp. TMED153]|nr:MAG: phenylacetate--CoA ligase family protein [Candidatus Pelagibacter sp. TMED153]
MSKFFDKLEIRSDAERADSIGSKLPTQIRNAKDNSTAFSEILKDVNPEDIKSIENLTKLPVLRKSELVKLQSENPPLGGLIAGNVNKLDQIFQSPGPIYEPGMVKHDWWRSGRALKAAGIGEGDIVQNCFSYHFTPAGMLSEQGILAVGATVFPAGTGQTELQARAAAEIGVTAYIGVPDFLQIILDKGEELGLDLSKIKKALVGGGPLFPKTRQAYKDRGILCLQNYGTADLGNVAYETVADAPMIVDEGVIVEIVTPGTGDPVSEGEIGEVLVTTLNPDYPLIRFATGDLSAVASGKSECGRTNMRIVGWRGRADQTTKIKGMFVRPEQVADLVARHSEIIKARVNVSRSENNDVMDVLLEIEKGSSADYENSVKEVLKLKGNVKIVSPGDLPNDGKVIDDQRTFD